MWLGRAIKWFWSCFLSLSFFPPFLYKKKRLVCGHISFRLGFMLLIYYFWRCCAIVTVHRLSLTVVSRGFSLAAGNTSCLRRWILLRSSGSRVCGPQWLPHAGSVVVVHKLSCPMARGFLPERGLNLHRLQWQADSQRRDHQGGRLEFKLTWLIDSRLALVLSYIHRESRSVGSLVSLGLGFIISWLVI